jgi:hypothetical protein
MAHTLSRTASVVIAACLMLGIFLAILGIRSTQKVLESLASSHAALVALTDSDVRARRRKAATARQAIAWCAEGVLSGPPCERLPMEQALEMLER